MLANGMRLTEAQLALSTALGVPAAVLPMSDDPVRTLVTSAAGVAPLQEFLIKARSEGPVEDVQFRGAGAAAPSPEVLAAIGAARAIVIGPSNPVISIGPIVAVPGLRAALDVAAAPIVAVSPLVRGTVVKGPTEPFMQWLGHPLSSDGIADIYGPLIDGLVADEQAERVLTLQTDVLMDTPAARARVAEQALTFALGLAAS